MWIRRAQCCLRALESLPKIQLELELAWLLVCCGCDCRCVLPVTTGKLLAIAAGSQRFCIWLRASSISASDGISSTTFSSS